MNDEHDTGVAPLLERALPSRPSDPHGLVAAAMTRGRAKRRRQQAGTAAAALAVFGVIGAVAAVVPLSSGGDRSAPVATGGPTSASDPTQSPTGTPTPPRLTPTDITITPQEIPAAVEQVVGRQEAGALRTGAEGPRDTPDEVIAHFDWAGTLTTVVVERVGSNTRAQCESGADATRGTCTTNADGDLQLTWGPTTGDGVSAQGVSVWRGTFEVSTLSYNAADGKGVAPLTTDPPLSLDDLTALATSDVWFD
ncbi:hypothetical protein H5V45_13190 [Nocardioides sp. KIGAM211]|uniref:Uncharacterized protein n=1 Tax=Nocardioides luti TaxID=2761101 RepID=A0A7X0RH83_9ACTN|nr:hypothetical protein [Nocardioides luti]MBB6628276.1 hypothetical protein [Nocardioides luti]